MKSFVEVRNAPVRQITLGELSADGGVVATEAQRESAVNQFLGNDLDDEAAEEPAEPAESNAGDGGGDGDEKTDPADPPAPASSRRVRRPVAGEGCGVRKVHATPEG